MYFQRYIVSPSPRYILPSDPCFSRPCLTVEKFTGGHPCTQIGRGREGGEHLVTLPARPSPRPKSSLLAVTLERHVSKSETMIFFFQEYILSGRDGIWKTCGGTIWISYRPRPLLFPLTEGLGALRRPPQTNQTSACTMGASFEFPPKLVSVLPRPIWFEYLILFLRRTVSADKLLP